MYFFRKNRRFIALIASVAILLSSIAPTLSYAFPAHPLSPDTFAEICSASGHKLAASASPDALFGITRDSRPIDNSHTGMAMEHCPYCLNHTQTPGMLSQREFSLIAIPLSYDYPSLFYQAPARLFIWASSSPRAPPLSHV
jgi:hypothetical protein